MGEIERRPKSGEFYRHFKNKLYQIVTVAVHSETGEEMVVYQALYGDYKTYVRPLSAFVSEVDREKYPDVTQKYRFERVNLGADAKDREEENGAQDGQSIQEGTEAVMNQRAVGEEREANPYLLEFLAADTYEEKLCALAKMRGHVGQIELDAVAMVLDVQPMRGEFQTQLDTFVQYVKTQQYYDGARLRRDNR